MSSQLVLAVFIIAVGLCVAGALAQLYQGLRGERPELRYDGRSYLGSLGNLAISFLCGPYIMLRMGWQFAPDDDFSPGMALLAALVAFGWAFITGLLVMSIYVVLQV